MKVLEAKDQDVKIEVPKFNRDKFLAWKSIMKLHLGGLRNHAKSTITNEHVDSIGALTVEDLKKEKKNTINKC